MDLPETSAPRPTRSHSDLRGGMTSDEGGDGTGLERHVRSPLLGLRLVRPDGAPVSPTSSIEAGRGRVGWSGAGSEDGTASQRERAGGDDDEMTPRPPGIITQVIKLDMDDVGPISVSWSD
ncbi:hypothetical protein ONZ45_g12919 [Pleurotus djamor]|nr:hypothetical protein ONZ45_g12919 [Pleurotus djamor]